jgi:hypothetical protein
VTAYRTLPGAIESVPVGESPPIGLRFAPCGVHDGNMSEAPRTRHTVRAVHTKPEFPPIVEACPSALAASIRAGQLYLSGYKVEIHPPLPAVALTATSAAAL